MLEIEASDVFFPCVYGRPLMPRISIEWVENCHETHNADLDNHFRSSTPIIPDKNPTPKSKLWSHSVTPVRWVDYGNQVFHTSILHLGDSDLWIYCWRPRTVNISRHFQMHFFTHFIRTNSIPFEVAELLTQHISNYHTYAYHALTHLGRVTHICVDNLTSIGSDNGLAPTKRQAIIRTNAGILLVGPLGPNFSEILIGIHIFSFKKMHLKTSSAKWQPFFSASVCYMTFTCNAHYLLLKCGNACFTAMIEILSFQ